MKIKEGGVMDIQKEREAFESWIKKEYPEMLELISHSDVKQAYDFSWEVWQAAKAQAVPEWISVEDKLPETEPNTDGVVCAVVCSLGNVYRARYMHDVDIGVDTKYWSEFAVNYNGREYEHYEINAKISHWMPLPDAPQEPAND
ncbi:TPA: DUF551 domain-containing protein [Acinetobacter baumannii]|uniref:DUF551 domain-containing protein n=1 Tax=Acinetobacter baumannii TaxID=470 RepID=UPI001EF68F75|nr:DUF551 domain-containing protein [Acinetobacter baumannii]MCF4632778.1 DUF551 domain-containing protein [Acinetobacter baumannii]HCQ9667066.1 DUF551 domain-containing protein [Acinetobacter baumannii]